MSVELKIPSVGESISEVEIGQWLKSPGDRVSKDEDLVTIESEKASVELPSPATGKLSKILKEQGQSAAVGDVIAYIDDGSQEEESEEKKDKASAAEDKNAPRRKDAKGTESGKKPGRKSERFQKDAKSEDAETRGGDRDSSTEPEEAEPRVMPAARRALDEHELSAEDVEATGPGGRLLKEDVLRHLEKSKEKTEEEEKEEEKDEGASPEDGASEPKPRQDERSGKEEEAVPMSMLRRTIAQRLVEAQQNAALLTTFNEIDMQAVMDLRKQHQEAFQQRYETKLGIMSFFVKACVDALKQTPQINAEIRGKQIIYKNYYDIGIAIGGGKGLVVPVLQNAERLSFGEIEQAIRDFGQRAQKNQLKPEELQGGTFTISNGGVYGSLLSTPIVNPPQSGVLGLHAIQDRPVAINGQVVIRPMMYVALTYDHRIVDGREAVTFLKRIKEVVESPARMLIEA